MKKVYVKWCDANSNAEWFTVQEALEWGADEEWEIESVGFLLAKTDEYILICQRFSGDMCGGLLKIPTTWIRKYKELDIDTYSQIQQLKEYIERIANHSSVYDSEIANEGLKLIGKPKQR